jgi:WD repeat and SOF domain-containing protein 1
MGRDKVRSLRYVFPLSLSLRSAPVTDITFSTSAESVTGVRFNPSEPSVLASIGSDRTFILYDIRTGKAERRIVMQVYAHP